MSRKKAIKIAKIIAGIGILTGLGYFLWRNGYSCGVRETADEEVKFIKENYPEAYRIIVGL